MIEITTMILQRTSAHEGTDNAFFWKADNCNVIPNAKKNYILPFLALKQLNELLK